ncbi:MAG: hypothetical protein ACFFEJ_06195 [Candidatus Thorarchaeota archaeon]
MHFVNDNEVVSRARRDVSLTEIEITKGTILLLSGTILMFASCLLGLFLYAGNFIFLLVLVGPVFGVLATYSAATDRDMSVFLNRLARFDSNPRYAGESCAALTFGFLAVGMNSIFLLTFGIILSDGFDANMLLITMILLLGTVLTGIGSYIAWSEWEG